LYESYDKSQSRPNGTAGSNNQLAVSWLRWSGERRRILDCGSDFLGSASSRIRNIALVLWKKVESEKKKCGPTAKQIGPLFIHLQTKE